MCNQTMTPLLRSPKTDVTIFDAESAREAVFVDVTIDGWETLVSDFTDAKPGVDVHYIDGSASLTQMAQWASSRSGYTAFHILSHGLVGTLLLGSSTVTLADLQTTEARHALTTIGRALAPDGDLLIYGCHVAQGMAGAEFLSYLAEMTGANVAASTGYTGATQHGGDWCLAARHGTVTTAPIASPNFAGVLAAPTVTAGTPVTYLEGDPAQYIAGDVTVDGGTGYAGGSVRFAISSPGAGDVLKLTSGIDGLAVGAISIDTDGTVYLGDGTTRNSVGSVDTVENGLDGQALKINFTAVSTAVFANSSFESGITGWTIGQDRVILGQTVINGHVSPDDVTDPPNSGDDAGSIRSMSYNYQLTVGDATDGTSSLRLYNSGQTAAGYDVVHGPYAYSNTFTATAGQVMKFDWKAAAGGDAYDAFGYLMNADTGQAVIALNETGIDDNGLKAWTTESVVVPQTGNWFFAFVSGTYDFSGGTAVGGSLYVDNFQVVASSVIDTVIEAMTSQVTYESTADEPIPQRTLTVQVADGTGEISSASSPFNVINVNDAPTALLLNGGMAGAVSQSEGLNAAIGTLSAADPDNTLLTYSLVNGAGDADNARFIITGNVLNAIDASTMAAGNYSILVAANDGSGGTVEQVLTITIADDLQPLAPTFSIAPVTNDTTPAITGMAEAGSIVTISNGAAVLGYAQADLDGNFTFIPAEPLSQGTYALSITAADAAGNISNAATATLVIEVNDAPTGAVAIDGTAADGFTLTASNTLADVDGLGPISYQWMADGQVIAGATSATFTVTANLVGSSISAVANYTDLQGTDESIASFATSLVLPSYRITTDGVESLFAALPFEGDRPDQIYQYIGSDGAESVQGTSGNDLMFLGEGNDRGDGGAGDDGIYGQGGDDFLADYGGHNVLDGGAGNDIVIAYGLSNIAFGGAGNDTLYGGEGADQMFGGTGDDVISSGAGSDIIVAGDGNDLAFGGDSGDTLYGNAGVDLLYGGNGNDVMSGGDDADILVGQAGDDLAFGDAGNDTLYGEAGNDQLRGDDGDDVISGGDGEDLLVGGNGNDLIFGDAGNDTLYGEAGDDHLRGGDGADILYGGDGNNLLVGGTGNDLIYGGSGVDTIFGEAGNDTLYGGAGNDVFMFGIGSGRDVIADFGQQAGNEDILFVKGFFADLEGVLLASQQVGGSVLINLTASDTIELANTQLGSLTSAEFLFA